MASGTRAARQAHRGSHPQPSGGQEGTSAAQEVGGAEPKWRLACRQRHGRVVPDRAFGLLDWVGDAWSNSDLFGVNPARLSVCRTLTLVRSARASGPVRSFGGAAVRHLDRQPGLGAGVGVAPAGTPKPLICSDGLPGTPDKLAEPQRPPLAHLAAAAPAVALERADGDRFRTVFGLRPREAVRSAGHLDPPGLLPATPRSACA